MVVSGVKIPDSHACGHEWEEFLRVTHGYSFTDPGPGCPTVSGNLEILRFFQWIHCVSLSEGNIQICLPVVGVVDPRPQS